MTSGMYHAHPALSHSRLKLIGRSPAHFMHYLTSDRESSEALDFGKLFHASILEPETVEHEFAVLPDSIDRRTKVGKAEYAAFIEASQGRTVVTQDQKDLADQMAKAISADPSANEIVFDAVATGRIEEAHVWTDGIYRIERKSKMDAVLKDGTVLDIKTTTDASPSAFSKSILTYGYHTQAAFYADAMLASGHEMRRFVIVAIEKAPPFAVGVYVLDRPAIDAGRKKVAEWLSIYTDCKASNTWPGYTPQPRLISIPAWALNQEESANDQW